MKNLQNFTKQHDVLLCIDSDGTAIDAMTCKHRLAHGPCLIAEWQLEDHRDEVFELWFSINLRGKHRGVNRFVALVICLEELKARGLINDDIAPLKKWVETTDKWSNDSILAAIEKSNAEVLKKAYSWACALDANIAKISSDDKRVFDGVKEFLQYVCGKVDIAVVTGATANSIQEEWDHFGISQYVSVLTGQEIGQKKDCINALLALGYDKNNVMMVGDSPLDYDSATACGVYFYPILTDKETQSWQDLKNKYLQYLFEGNFEQIQSDLIDKFLQN